MRDEPPPRAAHFFAPRRLTCMQRDVFWAWCVVVLLLVLGVVVFVLTTQP